MTAGMIDLDVSPADPAGEARPRLLRPGRPRLLLIIGVIVLALTGLGGSAPPPPGLTLVLSAGGTAAAAFTLGAETLYTAQYGVGNPNSESAVRAWNLADGSARWATAVPQGVQNVVVDEGAGVLVARSGTDPRISVLDARSGEVRWTSDVANTSLVSVARAGLLFTTDVPDGKVLRLADPRTGRTLWTRTVEAGVYFGPDDLWGREPTRIVAVGVSGTVVTLDFSTGAPLSQGDLGGPVRPIGGSNDGVLVSVLGDNRLVVNGRAQGRTTLTAYSLTPFAQLWQRSGTPVGTTTDCARVWCLIWLREGLSRNGDPGGVTAIDPASGADRWTDEKLTYATWFGDRGLLAFGTGESADLLQFEPETGRLIRNFGPAAPAGGELLVRSDTKAAGRAWVIGFGDDGVPYPLGAVDVTAAFGCEAKGRYLACPTTAGPTRVWRVP